MLLSIGNSSNSTGADLEHFGGKGRTLEPKAEEGTATKIFFQSRKLLKQNIKNLN